MVQNNIFSGSYNNLDFSFKTSSGDNISLSMYDNKEVSYESTQNANSSTQTYSLTHAYGYKFEYEGNGIDAKDKEEIAEAMKKLQPKIDDFMKNIQQGEIPTPQSILNTSREVADEIPKADTSAKKLTIEGNLLKLFDDNLEKYAPNEQVLQSSKTLFDRIREQLESFSMYM